MKIREKRMRKVHGGSIESESLPDESVRMTMILNWFITLNFRFIGVYVVNVLIAVNAWGNELFDCALYSFLCVLRKLSKIVFGRS